MTDNLPVETSSGIRAFVEAIDLWLGLVEYIVLAHIKGDEADMVKALTMLKRNETDVWEIDESKIKDRLHVLRQQIIARYEAQRSTESATRRRKAKGSSGSNKSK